MYIIYIFIYFLFFSPTDIYVLHSFVFFHTALLTRKIVAHFIYLSCFHHHTYTTTTSISILLLPFSPVLSFAEKNTREAAHSSKRYSDTKIFDPVIKMVQLIFLSLFAPPHIPANVTTMFFF